jgi:hypothetical protein
MKQIKILAGIVTVSVLGFVSYDKPTADSEQCVIEDTISPEIVSSKTQTDWELFIESVIEVESTNNDSAYNKKEDAVGCLQIRPIMVREVNRILKRENIMFRYTMEDRWDRKLSIEMFQIMAEEVDCCEGLTQEEFFEVVARKWNGGYRGHQKPSTLKYWERVKNKFGSLK